MKLLKLADMNEEQINKKLAELPPEWEIKFITTRSALREGGGTMPVHYFWYEERTAE